MMTINKYHAIGAAVLTFMLASDADAALQNYNSKFPVVEMNGSQGAGKIQSMLAAGLMGAKGFGNVVINGNDEAALLLKCQTATADITTWPGGCDIGGLASGLTSHFPGQTWLKQVYPGDAAGQQGAVNKQLTGLASYGSPSVFPLYGQVDHWGTMVRMYADMAVNPWVISKVWFYDAGDPMFVEDVEFNMYDDGLKSYSGATFKSTYYKVFSPGSISPNDAYWGKYIFAYEPPVQQAMAKDNGIALDFATGVPVLGDDEVLTAKLASEIVWDALELDGLLADPTYRTIADEGVAGTAWEVHARTPAGDPWDYFVVPIYDADMRGVLALVGLSAANGAFEQIRSFRAPHAIPFRSTRNANEAARKLLRQGESLVGSGLTWDPSCDDTYCRSPELPYYQYTVIGANRKAAGRVVVPIQGNTALRR